jgi:hypothetical protein
VWSRTPTSRFCWLDQGTTPEISRSVSEAQDRERSGTAETRSIPLAKAHRDDTLPNRQQLATCCLSDNPGVLAGRFIGRMGEPDVGSKHAHHFAKVILIWTKLCWAKRTLVITRKSPLAIFGCGEVGFCPHTQSLRRSLIHRHWLILRWWQRYCCLRRRSEKSLLSGQLPGLVSPSGRA